MAFDFSQGTVVPQPRQRGGGFDFSQGSVVSPAPLPERRQRPSFFERMKEAGETKPITGLQGVGAGIAKSFGKLGVGLGTLGTTIGRETIGRVLEAKGLGDRETFGAPVFREGTKESQLAKDILKGHSSAERAGNVIGEVAQFGIPSSLATKATKATPFIRKILARAGTGGSVGLAREGELGKEAGIAAGVEAAFPVAAPVGKFMLNVVKRLFRGTASGLSGVSVPEIKAIVDNPKVSTIAAEELAKVGDTVILRRNAKNIIDGVSSLRQGARKKFGDAIEVLSKENIKPHIFRGQIQKVLDKYKISSSTGERILSGVEFDNPKNIKKASEFIDQLSDVNLNGKDLRKLLDDIDASKFKTATSDERLSYNVFVKDLSAGLKKAINESTDVLKDANKEFSDTMQLVNATEGIFGKIKFKNLNELRIVSERLESLFTKKGIAPEVVDDFLKNIGIDPSDFKAEQAVSSITSKTQQANRAGLSISEMLQSVTSAVVTPQSVRDMAIRIGRTEQFVKQLIPVLRELPPAGRAALIRSLIGED